MIAPNYNKLCVEAERHYFDFLRDEAEQHVPSEVIDHIMGCHHCREQMSQLEAMLAECKEHPKIQMAQRQMATAAILKLHFSFVGKHVNCADARPFLPNLLEPTMQIRMPTPITAHIDNCDQCRDDSKKLQNLGLSHKQLITLSQLFADELDADETDCTAAREAIPAVVAMAFGRTDAKTLRHLSLCPKCRQELYKFRQTILEQTKILHSKNEIQKSIFPCSSVGAGDVFDYCIPYGIDPTSDEYATFRKSLTTHIVCCDECLDKIQQLHKTIYTIAERPESGVATVFHIDTTARVETESLYAGFPVRVEMANLGSQEQSHIEEYEKVVKLKPVSKNLRPLLKIALPAAALIMLGVGLLFNVHTAKGLAIEQIYRAIDMARNIHISRLVPDNQKPVQEVWIARNSGLYVIKTENECTLRDVSNSIQKTKDLGTGAIKQTSLSSDNLVALRNMIYGSLGIMPFDKSSDIPPDAIWSEITDFDHSTGVDNMKVYELRWTEKTLRSLTSHRICRVFTDASTNLPQKIQSFKQSASDSQPVMESTMIIEYPGDEEIFAKAKGMSF
jgi:predicted anti-sigma-YlaC factor YlaD